MTTRDKGSQSEQADQVRLNVFLQESGVASRRKADELISSGVVKVNGKTVSQLGLRILRTDKVHVQGKLVGSKAIPKVVYILNKPDMCLTTRFDAKMRRTIFDLAALKALPSNVQAVGRLDYRSEGLLLLTNDGDLAFALTHPKFSVEKTYAVLVSDGVTIEDVEKLRAGVMLDDGMAKAVSVRLGSKEKMGATRGQWLELVVTEGRNRLIRRMAEAIGLKVVRLVRVGMGEILLPATLKSGGIIPVDSAGQKQLEQIKRDMLSSMNSGRGRKAAQLDAETISKRKLKRQLKLNDEEYAHETVRRSAEASARRKQRIVSAATESADAPIPNASDRPQRGPVAKSSDRPQRGPVAKSTDRPQRGPVAKSSDRPQRGPVAKSSDRPQRGPVAKSSDRPQRGPVAKSSDRPQRGPVAKSSDRPQRGPVAKSSDRPQRGPTPKSPSPARAERRSSKSQEGTGRGSSSRKNSPKKSSGAQKRTAKRRG